MLDRAGHRIWAEKGATPPVDRLVIGRPVSEVAAIIPRIFNLCPAAQSLAIKAASGQQVSEEDKETLRREICREHAVRLAVLLPMRFGTDRVVLPKNLVAQRHVLLGAGLPDPTGFEAYLISDAGIAPLLADLTARFAPHEACANGLAFPDAANVLLPVALENSVAARHLGHPLLSWVAQTFGRGPLWRVLARAVDFEAASRGIVPPIQVPKPGMAIVPAARGAYALRMELDGQTVTAFERVTPTDHLLADGGVMAQTLASLPEDKHHEASLIVDLLDPCSPVTVKGADHA